MALTAPVTTGTYSPFWALTSDHVPYSISQAQGRSKDAWHVSRFMQGMTTRDAAAALGALIGAVSGGVATSTFTQVPVPSGPSSTVPTVTGVGDLGGLRTATTYTSINRATSTPDVNELKRWFASNLREAGITYPTTLGSSMARGAMHSGTPGFS